MCDPPSSMVKAHKMSGYIDILGEKCLLVQYAFTMKLKCTYWQSLAITKVRFNVILKHMQIMGCNDNMIILVSTGKITQNSIVPESIISPGSVS